jgi:hypothetical protein
MSQSQPDTASKMNPSSDDNKRGSLIQNNQLKFWLSETIMKNMDKSNYARIMFLFSIIFFFLGRDLNIFTKLVVVITIYMLIIRTIRFYVKRWLLYLLEFCYFGIIGLMLFLSFFSLSKTAWGAVYSYGTGNMAIAIILFNNQALFTSSDHMASAWLHSAPLITCWAIRWRSIIYEKHYDSFISESDMLLNGFDIVRHMIIYPIIFWAFWALCYTIFLKVIFKDISLNPKYEDGLLDFIKLVEKNKNKFLKYIIGDPKKFTLLKYLINHFGQFMLGLTISNICYFNFYVNTIYVLLLIFYMFWSAGKSHQRIMEKKVQQTLEKAESDGIKNKNE